ncbi:unnamed protein product [Blumeria hordei]|uniref:RRM domain-containing protein n=2 Tax=Blumeria hordei TaxID=2867405 RepID=A0A383UUY9_BLUHO|nr:putative RNA binding protein [Blumeria hordei DH14]SZF03599.1 unnamed protein product [Blumeria hordei]
MIVARGSFNQDTNSSDSYPSDQTVRCACVHSAQNGINSSVLTRSSQEFCQTNLVQLKYQPIKISPASMKRKEEAINLSRSSNDTSTLGPYSVFIRGLPPNMTEENLRSMFGWSEEFIAIETLPFDQSEDSSPDSAVIYFHTHSGALEAKNILEGKANMSRDSSVQVEIFYSGSLSPPRRFGSDSTAHTYQSTSASSSPSSSGCSTPRQATIFKKSFQQSPRMSSNSIYAGTELPKPNDSTLYQNLFSPQSPFGNHPSEGTRVTGKSLIKNDYVDDEETRELLKDPVAYAENGHSVQSRRQKMNSQGLNPRINSLVLNMNTNANTTPRPAYLTPNPAASRPNTSSMTPISANSLNNIGSSMAYRAGRQQFQRNNFPLVNPADQNPPCNTLYVGNLPIDTSEDELKAMFSKQRGYKRLCFRAKQNGPMCFVEFEDISFATKALHELYGYPLHNSVKGGIRLSFSKNPLGVRSGHSMTASTRSNHSGNTRCTNGISTNVHGCFFSTVSGPPPGLINPKSGSNPSSSNISASSKTNSDGLYTSSNNIGYCNANGWIQPVFNRIMTGGGQSSMAYNGFPTSMIGR